MSEERNEAIAGFWDYLVVSKDRKYISSNTLGLRDSYRENL